MVACPIDGLVGQTSALKKLAPQGYLLFDQNQAESWQASQAQEIHQNEPESQSFVHQDVEESGDLLMSATHQSQVSGAPH